MTVPTACATCAEKTTTKRYCAPARCYCGHTGCPAFSSYVDLDASPLVTSDTAPAKPTSRSSWDDREESTWIDQL